MLTKLGTATAGIAFVVAGLLYVKQESLLYFPEIGGLSRSPAGNPRGYRSPRERQIPFESNMIPCADGVKIHSWLLLTNKPGAPTLLFFHGNAGNIGLRLPNGIQMLQNLNANILLVEYRGYGDSESVPSEPGLRKDAEAALHFCQTHPQIDPNKLFIFGRSLGGAVAFHLAEYAQQEQIPVAGVIVENTFTSIGDMVDKLLPVLAPFKMLVLRIGWKSKELVPQLNTPTLYLAGDRDEIVPHEHMLELVQLQRQVPKRTVEMHVIEGGTHNESWLQGGPAYWDAIRNFMSRVGSGDLGTPNSKVTTGAQGTPGECDANTATRPGGAAAASIPTMSTNFVDMARGSMASPPEKDKKKD